MRIGIDLSITRLNQAGSANFASNLFIALQQCAPEHLFQVFSVKHQRQMGTRKTWRSRLMVIYNDLVWTHIVLPWQVMRSSIELLHMPANITPVFSPKPTVVTVNDVLVVSNPESFPIWQRNYAKLFYPLSARRAQAILTISEYSKQEIVRHLNVSPDKIYVTPLAASDAFRLVEKSQVVLGTQKYGLDKFILTVCTLEPRKNLTVLFEAFAQIKRAQPDFPYKLVHVGPKEWMFDTLFTLVERLGLVDDVVFLGHVPLEDLVLLYNGASLFVYPSLYEGFGLPVLEAMSCGCPVITSNTTSLPEVAGNAAILTDPTDADGISRVITEVLSNEELAQKLRIAGLERAKLFSWLRCAQQTLEVYQAVLAKY